MEEKCVVVEEYVPEKRGHFSSWFRGILLGSMIGAGVALLSTPRSGIENRVMLRQKGNELKDKAVQTAEQTRSRAQEMVQMGADRATEVVQQGQTVLDEQKAKIQNVVYGVREGVKSYQDQGGLTIEDGDRESDQWTRSTDISDLNMPDINA